ncbi:MAG: Mth938-like domain-containing protein [Halofilum sp. (in: g-proteobacteria)]
MKVSLETGSASHRIRAYDEGSVTVNQDVYTSDLIVMPEAIVTEWANAPVAELTPDHLAVIAPYEPEIVLLGTGRRQRFPSAQLMADLARKGIGLEAMDTAAACRTYNVLMSEDRRVAAALLLIEPDLQG